MFKYSTEYLIMNEDSIDWEELSSIKDDSFSLIEIRLFRKNINWSVYLNKHRIMSTEELEMASKYFTDDNYRQIAAFNIATDRFVLDHPEKFNMSTLLKGTNLSEETVIDLKNYWENEEVIRKNYREFFKKAAYINLDSPEYSMLALLIESL